MTPFGEIPSVDELDDWQLEEEVEGRERNGQSGTDPSLQTELHNFSTWSSRDKSLESSMFISGMHLRPVSSCFFVSLGWF